MLRNGSGICVLMAVGVLLFVPCVSQAANSTFSVSSVEVTYISSSPGLWQYTCTTLYSGPAADQKSLGRFEIHFPPLPAHGGADNLNNDTYTNGGDLTHGGTFNSSDIGSTKLVSVYHDGSLETDWNMWVETDDTDDSHSTTSGLNDLEEVDIWRTDKATENSGTYTFTFDIVEPSTWTPPSSNYWQGQTPSGQGHGTDTADDSLGIDISSGTTSITFDSGSTPEPRSLSIILCGLCLGGWQFRRRKH